MNDVLSKLRKELKKNVELKTKISSQRFFKEKVKGYGVKTPIVQKIALKYFKEIKDRPKEEIFNLCEELLQSDYIEEAFIAFSWSNKLSNQFEEKDFSRFANWVKKYVNNWAKCDVLCNHSIGSFVEKYPYYLSELKKWTKSPNRWVKRAAAVTLIVPAKHGKFLKEVFAIADSLLEDKDDLVQKGYGWLLKEASRKHQTEVFNYVLKNKKVMPRTALRYAIEKLPPDLRKKAMEKH